MIKVDILCPTGRVSHQPLCTAGPSWIRKGVSQLYEAPNTAACTAVGDSCQPPGCQVGAAMEGPEEGKKVGRKMEMMAITGYYSILHLSTVATCLKFRSTSLNGLKTTHPINNTV